MTMTLPKKTMGALVLLGLILGFSSVSSHAVDWNQVAKNLMADYQGKIISIKKLNSSSCWIVVSPSLNTAECVKLAENIGYYIRNSTGGPRSGQTPTVHVSQGTQQIAVARPSGMQYKGKLNIKSW
jgi:hypothetical protein